MSQPFFGFREAQLGVWERDPYPGHFAGGKIGLHQVNLRTQKSDILQILFNRFPCANPYPVPFQVHADKIVVGVKPAQAEGIFSLATGQFKGDGMGISKMVLPVSGHVLGKLEDVIK